MMKKQPHYEYSREFKKQTSEIKAMITTGEKTAMAKKKKKKKKKPTLLQKTKKRLRRVFGKKGY